jgi:hypothetical protein
MSKIRRGGLCPAKILGEILNIADLCRGAEGSRGFGFKKKNTC